MVRLEILGDQRTPRLGPTGRGSPRGAPVGSSLSTCSMTDAASDIPAVGDRMASERVWYTGS